jgi:dihydroorotate dehydrogenase electron transfer subunit
VTHPAEAAHFADHAWHGTVTVQQNVRLARDTFRVRFDCPEIARRIVPGQFVMLRLAGYNDPLLGRPLALYDTVLGPQGTPQGLDVVYLVLGRMTGKLARFQPGQELEIWGPLGNGFPPPGDDDSNDHLLMVAGGIGQTPFLALAQEYLGRRTYGDPARAVRPARRVTLCYGARNAEYLAGVADFERLAVQVRISTDDGTAGHHGRVTEIMQQVIEEDPRGVRIVCCGPEPMMAAVAQISAQMQVPCQVSLETPMACGIGICFSCVARVRDEQGEWDYRRTCVEGPVFDSQRIEF